MADKKKLTDADFESKPRKLTDADFGGEELGGLDESITTINEMHPDISYAERFKLKNFSNNPMATLEAIKKEHPDLELARDKDQILIRRPGEQQFRKLDPSPELSWQGLKDLVPDIGDAIYDLGAGSASATAAAGAATLAAPATGGLGSIPAAMGAGGATNAGLEALRQEIGKVLGIPQETDASQIATQGVIGTVSPLAFGTGVSKEALKKAIPTATETELAKYFSRQSGIPGRAFNYAKDKILPVVGETVSGASRESIRDLSKNLPQIEALEKEGVTDFVEGTHGRLVGTLAEAKKQYGKNLESAIKNAGQKVNLSEAKQPMKKLIAELEAIENKNPDLISKLDDLKAMYTEAFGDAAEKVESKLLDATGAPMISTPKEIPNEVSAMTAFKLQETLKDQAELAKLKNSPMGRLSGKSATDARAAEAARESYKAINSELDRVTKSADDAFGGTGAIKQQYKRIADIQNQLNPYFKTPDATYTTLMSLGRKPKRMLFEKLQRIDDEFGTKMIDDAKLLESYSIFSKPSLDPMSSMGTTSTSRSVPLAESAGDLGYYMGAGMGPGAGVAGRAIARPLGQKLGSPAAIRKMVELNQSMINPARQASPYMLLPILNELNSKPRE